MAADPTIVRAVKIRQISSLHAADANARLHGDDQIMRLAASIQQYGFTNPILIDADSVVIAGHGRLAAAAALGMEKVPCIVLAHLTDAQRRAYAIADNQIPLDATWDYPVLIAELSAAMEAGLAEFVGFDQEELSEMLLGAAGAPQGLTDGDDAPEAQEAAVSREGDVWLCGRHRVACGDSTKAEDVARLLAGVEPHLMVTDPPYGVEYDPDWRNRADRANGKPYGACAVGQVTNDDRADWREAWALFSGDVAYVWAAPGPLQVISYQSLEASGLEVRVQIIWAKSRPIIGRGHYHGQHEPCWYAVRKGKTGHWTGSRQESTLWQIEHMKSVTGHGTQKPVECMRRPIVNNSNPGQAVYDPFLGSGTTMIAAEKEGRICYGMEISPNYVDVAVRRWEAFTGEEATLDADGRRFEEVQRERDQAGGDPAPAISRHAGGA